MNRPKRIQSLIKAACQTGSGESDWTSADERIVSDASTVMRQACSDNQRVPRICIWRTMMKNRRTRLATAAALAAAVVLSVAVMDWLAPPAWAIGQTVKALRDVRSIVIRGVGYDDGTTDPFTLSIRPSQDGAEGLDMRFECREQLTVVRGKKAWVYWPDKNVVDIYEDVTTSYGMMRDLQWWYDLAALNPWVTGKILAATKHIAKDWEEAYGRDEHTGRDSVFVTCGYGSESTFWFVCDLETKLIVEAKYWNWSSPDPEGPPACHATSFTYNEDLDDAVFELQIPEGARIVDKAKTRKIEQEARVLSDRAERLFMEGKFAQSIEIYQQVYDRYPDLTDGVPASTALCMMGSAYLRLGEPEKAVEVLRKQRAEYGHLEGSGSAYDSLGRAYMDMGENLFHNEKKYAEALKIYQQVYDTYPDQIVAEEALMMVGLCHRRLGQRDKEIAAYEKAVSEYAHLKGWIEATYFYLGRAYMEGGQKEKALEAFENCLRAGQGVRRPDQFPLKEARQCIDQIKGQ